LGALAFRFETISAAPSKTLSSGYCLGANRVRPRRSPRRCREITAGCAGSPPIRIFDAGREQQNPPTKHNYPKRNSDDETDYTFLRHTEDGHDFTAFLARAVKRIERLAADYDTTITFDREGSPSAVDLNSIRSRQPAAALALIVQRLEARAGCPTSQRLYEAAGATEEAWT
jgi:hypothetical protein